MATENTVLINQDNWESEVVSSDKPVLVDFWAEWCGPCKAISPILDELSTELEGKLKIAKVNVDENPELASQFGVRSIPTLIVFQGGEAKEQMVGSMSKTALKEKIEPHLG